MYQVCTGLKFHHAIPFPNFQKQGTNKKMRKVSTPSAWCEDCYLSKEKTGYFSLNGQFHPKFVLPLSVLLYRAWLLGGRGLFSWCLQLFFRLVKYQRSYRSPAEWVIICYCRGSLSQETQQRRVWTLALTPLPSQLLLKRNHQRQDFGHGQFALGQRNLRIQQLYRASYNSAYIDHVYQTYTMQQRSSSNYVSGISSFPTDSLFLLSNSDTSLVYLDIHWGHRYRQQSW